MSTNAFGNLFAESKTPQVDYATFKLGAVTNYEQILKEGFDFAKYNYGYTDNAGYSSGGPFPTVVKPGNHDVSVSYSNEEMTPYLLVKRLYQALGAIDSTTVTAGANRIHKISLLNLALGLQLPMYSYVEKNGEKAVSGPEPNPHNIGFESLVTSQFSLSGGDKAVITATSEKVGSGLRIVNPAVNIKSSPVHVAPNVQNRYFQTTSALLKFWKDINQTGTLNSIGCSFRNFQLNINPNLKTDDGYKGCGRFFVSGNSNSGTIRNRCEIGLPTVEATVDIIFDDNYDPVAIMQSLAPFSLELKYTGGLIGVTSENYEAIFKFGKTYFTSVDTTILEDKNGLSLKLKPFANGFDFPFEVWVQNDTTTYV